MLPERHAIARRMSAVQRTAALAREISLRCDAMIARWQKYAVDGERTAQIRKRYREQQSKTKTQSISQSKKEATD